MILREQVQMKTLIAAFWELINTFISSFSDVPEYIAERSTSIFVTLKTFVVKKYFVAIALLTFAVACGSNSSEKKEEKPAEAAAAPAAAPANDLASNPDYEKGLALVAKSDCLTCHKVSEKLTGPAYKDVAAKYESTDENISMLASKIIKGGQGVWGTIPMTPHPTVSEDDAKQMVKYILLLRNK